MRRLALFLTLAANLCFGSPTLAGTICSPDVTPAATLLLPYFEVDLAALPGTGKTTLIAINNASLQPVLARVQFWTEFGVPVFGFPLFLKGFDVQTINLADILVRGLFPQTQPTAGLFPSCAGVLPPATIAAAKLEDYQKAMTGRPVESWDGRCGSRESFPTARGYMTVDAVNTCSQIFHADAGYFAPGGNGIASNRNVLWGDFSYVDLGTNLAEGSPLVHIEASASNPETSRPGHYTFYGRYVAWNAADNREPLPTKFGIRYLNGLVGGPGGTPGVSDLIVWRDPKAKVAPFTCPAAAGRPSWYPLLNERTEVADETGRHYRGTRSAFPVVAQRVRVGAPPLRLRTGYDFGWMYLDLNTAVAAAGANPPEDPGAAQAWVGAVHAAGSWSTGLDAMSYDSDCNLSRKRHTFP